MSWKTIFKVFTTLRDIGVTGHTVRDRWTSTTRELYTEPVDFLDPYVNAN